jgi:UDP-N-acetylglucosamine--N-acetylmuramyl-(pentapeptide) pyrophosphoryl-undecaprenol N-acetylglucosamine transferase
LILEQNAFPGLTNRILARFVKEIAYSFPGSERHFAGGKAKLTLTGNPIRREILQGRRERAAVEFDLDPHRFTLLTFGGSQGASKINHSLLEALPHLLPLREKLQFLHATGEKDFEAVASGFAQHPFSAKVHPFIRDMASAYALADLVISRAGASTIAELAALGKPSILIPYPYAANDHQRHNAQALANTGGAQVLLDQELKGTTLARLIERAFQDPEGREAMGRRARAWAKVDADDQIADLIWGLASHPG